MISENERLNHIFEWACRTTAEQSSDEYLWRSDTQSLMFRLKHARGSIVGVSAYRGMGKTSLGFALEKSLVGDGCCTYRFLWSSPEGERMKKEIIEKGFSREYINKLVTKVVLVVLDEKPNDSFKYLVKNPFIIKQTKLMEAGLSQKAAKEIQMFYAMLQLKNEDLVYLSYRKINKVYRVELENFLFNRNIDLPSESSGSTGIINIIVDMEDYDSRFLKQFSNDLSEIWSFYRRLCEEFSNNLPNMVVFIQRELWNSHFVLGKLSPFHLKPFSPNELLQYYKNKWGVSSPFTEKAILQIGILCRGVFRRFKDYLVKCLSLEKELITIDDVNKTITLEMLTEDMVLELKKVFPRNEESRFFATTLLKTLGEAENNLIPQNEMVDKIFDGNKVQASRILNKLDGKYIKREYSEDGRRKNVSLIM